MRTQIVFLYSIYPSLKKIIFLDKYQSQSFAAFSVPRQQHPCVACLPREKYSSPQVVGRFRSKYTHNLWLQRGEPIPHTPASAGTRAFSGDATGPSVSPEGPLTKCWKSKRVKATAANQTKLYPRKKELGLPIDRQTDRRRNRPRVDTTVRLREKRQIWPLGTAPLGKQQKTSRAITSPQTQSNLTNLKIQMTNKKVSSLIIHIKATFNNTLLTLTNFKGQVITWVSAGSCGFKGARKGTPFAAKKVVEIFMKKSNDHFRRCDQIKIYVCGVGPGRENAIRGLAAISKTIQQATPKKGKTQRMNKAAKLSNKIILIREMTKIPHNGCRPTKKRRI